MKSRNDESGLPTPKQLGFIQSLLKEIRLKDKYFELNGEPETKDEASLLISELIVQRDRGLKHHRISTVR